MPITMVTTFHFSGIAFSANLLAYLRGSQGMAQEGGCFTQPFPGVCTNRLFRKV